MDKDKIQMENNMQKNNNIWLFLVSHMGKNFSFAGK